MQMELIHESINDALREAITALGGMKKVGQIFWADQTPERAATKLGDCLNPDRRERLTPDQVIHIMRLARGKGCHSVAAFILRETGYADPVPVEPEDEVAKLQREFVNAAAGLQEMVGRIEAAQARVESKSKLRAA